MAKFGPRHDLPKPLVSPLSGPKNVQTQGGPLWGPLLCTLRPASSPWAPYSLCKADTARSRRDTGMGGVERKKREVKTKGHWVSSGLDGRPSHHGVSLEAQEGRVRDWCNNNGYVLAEVFVDRGFSGGRPDIRPALQEALVATRRRGDALVVYSLSRLARSTKDTLEIADALDRR